MLRTEPVIRPPTPAAPAARRALAVSIGLSLAIHVAALLDWLPRLPPIALDVGQSPAGPDPLVARLIAKAAEPEPVAPPVPPPSPPVKAQAPETRPPVLTAKAAPIPPIAPPLPVPERVPALREPLPALAPLPEPPPPVPAAKPSVAQIYPDLAAYVAARRAARGAPSTDAPADADTARRDRIVAANLATVNSPTFGAAEKNTGGLFQITHLGSDLAEFTFFGWNKDIKRRASQRIEVRRGNAPDIRIAVVRRMIAVIREYEQEDFTWRSQRLGREVTLSARAVDTAGLEDFLMRDFF